jgi:hypothetical protein
MSNASQRGFGSMGTAERCAIASKGGKAAHARGRAHRFTREKAREAAASKRHRAAGIVDPCVGEDDEKLPTVD